MRLSKRAALFKFSDSKGFSVWPASVGELCSCRTACGPGASGSKSEIVLRIQDPELFPDYSVKLS